MPPTASRIIHAGTPCDCRPWPRFELTPEAWFTMTHALPAEPGLAFVALWADTTQVHALLQGPTPLIASTPVEAGLYAALSPARPAAALFERAIADLWGHQAADAIDVRPWLDHGVWPMLRPLSDRPVPNAAAPEAAEPDLPEMHQTEGHALPAGPLSPGIIDGPAHFLTTIADPDALDPKVAALEARFGYAHRGVLGLMRGKSPSGAARIVARINGAATVAHATAFARAIEAAVAADIPPRAKALRAAMLATERVAVRLHDLHAAAQAAGQDWPALQPAREAILAACATAFGHRLMMDVVRPGGIATDPSESALAALETALAAVPVLTRTWPPGGTLTIAAALALGLPAAAGRASGRLDLNAPIAPILASGDIPARMALLARDIDADIESARNLLTTLPDGETLITLPHEAAEGLAMAAGPQGPVWHWVRLANATVAASFAMDPAWLNLPATEQASANQPLERLPLIAGSFTLRTPGMDL